MAEQGKGDKRQPCLTALRRVLANVVWKRKPSQRSANVVLLAFSFIVKIKPWVAYKATGIVTENLYWGNKRGRHRAAACEYGK
mmetsp:Transcript_12834/g.41513  ORF Transcript_12834/g.41513 Transcript_12834/m.41513 type:complete len:83 (-) Transcript_12834:7-255(-)